MQVISLDNGIRPSSLESLSRLRPSFDREKGTITAANSSFLSDGASACIVATESTVKTCHFLYCSSIDTFSV